jgi:hypothetical protein
MPKITYGKLDEIIRSFGFEGWTNESSKPPARVYKHEASGAMFLLPVTPDDEEVQAWHLVGIRMTLDNFGVAAPAEFDSRLQKAG